MTKPVNDIVERLRNLAACDPECEGRCRECPDITAREAADEIERLRMGESICIKCGQRQHAEASYDIQF